LAQALEVHARLPARAGPRSRPPKSFVALGWAAGWLRRFSHPTFSEGGNAREMKATPPRDSTWEAHGRAKRGRGAASVKT
jgi:hypothetical protein